MRDAHVRRSPSPPSRPFRVPCGLLVSPKRVALDCHRVRGTRAHRTIEHTAHLERNSARGSSTSRFPRSSEGELDEAALRAQTVCPYKPPEKNRSVPKISQRSDSDSLINDSGTRRVTPAPRAVRGTRRIYGRPWTKTRVAEWSRGGG